jgi:hypothetical protein
MLQKVTVIKKYTEKNPGGYPLFAELQKGN